MEDMPGTTTARATQACLTCRKQKRKCDKLLPACSRCASLQRPCDYSDNAPAAAPTAEDFAALQTRLVDIEARLNPRPEAQRSMTPTAYDAYMGSSHLSSAHHADVPTWSNRFPSVFFLDTDVYRFANKMPPKPEVDIPPEVLDILSSSEVIQEAISTYFNTIHKWFAFISRKRMNLGISLAGGGPDLTLLFLAIKLITTPPPPQPRSADKLPLYQTTKHFLHLLEAAGTTSILYLQSQILIALYEYSHAIYPSAYLSVGACVRYASLLGLPSYAEASAVLGPCTTWTETEERRRTWWATHILDRVVSLGSKRPFASGPPAAPPTTELLLLPTDDDAAWDAGDTSRALLQQRPLSSTPLDAPTNSPFSRLAQAAALVSRAMAHCCRRRAVATRWKSGHPARSGCPSGDDAVLGDHNVAAMEEKDDDDNNNDKNDDEEEDEGPVNIREVTALIQELDTLCKACKADMARAGAVPGSDAYFGFLTARCVSSSAVVMVLDLYSCPEHMRPGAGRGEEDNGAAAAAARSEAELALQVEAINGLKTAGLYVREEAMVLLGVMEGLSSEEEEGGERMSVSFGGEMYEDSGPPEVNEKVVARISPLCLDVIYCGMSTFGWLWRESGDPEMKQGLEITRRCLEKIGTRWRLADEYLEIGKQQDGLMMEIMSLNGA